MKEAHIRHLLGIDSLDKEAVTYLLDKTEYFLKEYVIPKRATHTLEGRILTNLFFEPSTRTRSSFEIAAKRLGALVLTPDMKMSATVKGESLIDTVHNYEAMGT